MNTSENLCKQEEQRLMWDKPLRNKCWYHNPFTFGLEEHLRQITNDASPGIFMLCARISDMINDTVYSGHLSSVDFLIPRTIP